MIQLTNVNFIYSAGSPFEKKALDGINLKINTGDFVGLIGHTGSGKSTLVQLIAGLLKPTSGSILIDGVDITQKKSVVRELDGKIGLVFQYPEHQLFEETVYKDIAFGPKNLGIPDEEIDVRIREALKMVGLSEDILDKSPFELSGGQKRRVAISGILAMKPEILILDEPTAGLDPRGRDEILSKIKKLHEKDKSTVILVSHSMEDVAKVAESVIVMCGGKIAMQGSVADVFSRSDELVKIGLNAPQISRIANGLKKRGINIDGGIYTVADAKRAILNLLKEVE